MVLLLVDVTTFLALLEAQRPYDIRNHHGRASHTQF